MRLRRSPAGLDPDPTRVLPRLFLPGEEVQATRSRAQRIVDRVLAVPEAEVARRAAALLEDGRVRLADAAGLFREHARIVASRVEDAAGLSPERELVLGAAFTMEVAVEGAALCNPSAVPHPDQSGLGPGELRLALGLRAIGEGHTSSIAFAEAVVGPGERWTFAPRAAPPVAAAVTGGTWRLGELRAALDHLRRADELAAAVLRELPDTFRAVDVEQALAALPMSLQRRKDADAARAALRGVVGSIYDASFPADSALGQRVLQPVAAEEVRGMEDARLVRFTDDDGAVEYRATYTAYDGERIAPRLLTTTDFRSFRSRRLSGPAARSKGMALFPRTVGGRQLAVVRIDGETLSLAASDDGVVWSADAAVQGPEQPWEVVQTGNCGSPIETDRGWLLLTHSVGPLRTYCLGALLLDRDDPSRVLARAVEPLLEPQGDLRDGYVPNVVYSCGGVVHDGVLHVPCGVGDQRVRVFSAGLDEVLDSLQPAT